MQRVWIWTMKGDTVVEYNNGSISANVLLYMFWLRGAVDMTRQY